MILVTFQMGARMSKKQIRLSLDVSPELNNMIDEMAEKTNSSKSDVLRKSIVLLKIAVQENEKGNNLAIVDKDQKILKEIVGLFSVRPSDRRVGK